MNEMATLNHSTELVAESMTATVLSSAHIQARVNMIQGAIKQIFKDGVHFGTIPGTQKPTLYKPGAEQLLVMFRIAPFDPKTEDLSTADSIRYRVTRGGQSQIDGRFLGAGTGECSSDEEKYKWRKPVCEAEWDETSPERRREVWRKFKGVAQKVKQVRTNPADVANTILKMADKRALVAMTLVVTGASDAFSQDIEDLPEELREAVADEGMERAPIQQPARKTEATQAPVPGPTDGVKRISEKQRGRFYAIWKSSGRTEQEVKDYLISKIGVADSREIPVDLYESVCEWAEEK